MSSGVLYRSTHRPRSVLVALTALAIISIVMTPVPADARRFRVKCIDGVLSVPKSPIHFLVRFRPREGRGLHVRLGVPAVPLCRSDEVRDRVQP